MDSFLWFTTFLSMMYHSVTVTENANKKKKKKKKKIRAPVMVRSCHKLIYYCSYIIFYNKQWYNIYLRVLDLFNDI